MLRYVNVHFEIFKSNDDLRVCWRMMAQKTTWYDGGVILVSYNPLNYHGCELSKKFLKPATSRSRWVLRSKIMWLFLLTCSLVTCRWCSAQSVQQVVTQLYGHGEHGSERLYGGLGALPPVGCRGKAPGQRVWGRSPQKLEHISQEISVFCVHVLPIRCTF